MFRLKNFLGITGISLALGCSYSQENQNNPNLDNSDSDRVFYIKNKEVLKKANKFDKNLEEDIIVAKRVEEAWKEIEQGKFKRMSPEDFLKEIRNL